MQKPQYVASNLIQDSGPEVEPRHVRAYLKEAHYFIESSVWFWLSFIVLDLMTVSQVNRDEFKKQGNLKQAQTCLLDVMRRESDGVLLPCRLSAIGPSNLPGA